MTPPKLDSAQRDSATATERSLDGSVRAGIRLVDAAPFYEEQIELFRGDAEEHSHSLHHACAYPNAIRPEVAAFLINRFSRRGETVLDPFCGSGTVPLEANFAGRVGFASDAHPMAMALTRAKLEPADLAEVTLSLQGLPLRRPVDLSSYHQIFQHFYDPETFREVANLRGALAGREDRVSRFLTLVALGILHGPSAGSLSVYTNPAVSLTPQAQLELNVRRKQSPDYRAVLPRLLRKTASTLRDGIPSSMRQLATQNRLAIADARQLDYVGNRRVDLALFAPPLPGTNEWLSSVWLRSWFLAVPARKVAESLFIGEVAEWLRFMNETLLEVGRVVRGGGRTALVLQNPALVAPFLSMVQQELPRFWNVECLLSHREQSGTVAGAQRSRRGAANAQHYCVVVLRRR